LSCPLFLVRSWLKVTDTSLAFTSDEVLVAKLKSTALFQTLISAQGNKATANVILSPAESLLPTSMESIGNRFKGRESQESIQLLQVDYEAEVARTSEIVQSGESRSWFEDVFRLVKQAQEEADQTQVAMEEEDGGFITMY
jgi:hypothetical protein